MTVPLRRQPLVEQTAAHLREGFISGRWTGYLPGVLQLAGDLVVSKHLVRGALRILEEEGSIEYSGAGKRRRILIDRNTATGPRTLRVAVILHDSLEEENAHICRMLLGIRESIESSGHTCVFASENLTRIGDNLTRISRLVKQTQADAWILFQASTVVIEWFVSQAIPTFALGGRFVGLPVASSTAALWPAILSAVDHLADQGHRRIVWVWPSFFRKPSISPSGVKFLNRLEEHGIQASPYNLPDYEETGEGLAKLMDELFRITPPTALMFLDPGECMASLLHLTRRGLELPRDVSILCMTRTLRCATSALGSPSSNCPRASTSGASCAGCNAWPRASRNCGKPSSTHTSHPVIVSARRSGEIVRRGGGAAGRARQYHPIGQRQARG